MAQHKSAEKRNRQNEVRRVRNQTLRSRMRTAIKTAREAVASNAPNKGDTVKAAIAEVYSMASKKVLTRQTASRYVSRLMRAAAK